MMSDYFSEKSDKKKMLTESSMPVSPQKCEWVIHTSPERFYREFKFTSKQQVLEFISEILRYESAVNHSGTQTISGYEVSVEVYTHDVNKVTELDQEYAKHVGYIYEDVLSFGI